MNFSNKNYQKFFYQSSFADTVTQTDVSDFNVSEHENTIRELNESVEKPSRELKQLLYQSKNTNLILKLQG